MRFECSLIYFQKIQQKEFSKYFEKCSQRYTYINWLDLYYKSDKINDFIVITLMTICLICCIYFIKFVSQKYLAPALFYIRQLYKLSLKVTTLLLIPLSNGIPDLMVAVTSAHMKEGLYITLGTLFGSFLFVTTIIISVIVKNEDSKASINRNVLFTYLTTLFILCMILMLYGYLLFINFWHALLLPIAFGIYLLVSIYFLDHDKIQVSYSSLDQDQSQNVEDQIYGSIFNLSESAVQSRQAKGKNLNSTQESFKGKKNQVEEQQQEEEQTMYLKDYLFNENYFKIIFEFIFKILVLFTIPFNTNPFLGTRMKYLTLLGSTIFIVFSLMQRQSLYLAGIITASIYVIATIIICLLKKSEKQQKVFLFFCLISSVLWVKLLTTFMLDCFVFVSFLSGISETFLSIFVISIVNSIGDLFSFHALSQGGHQEMAIMGIFSCEILNSFLGIFINIVISKNYFFNIFALHVQEEHPGRILLRYLILFVIANIVMHFIYLLFNKWIYKSSFQYLGFSFYFMMFGFLIAFVIKEHEIFEANQFNFQLMRFQIQFQ